MVPPRSHQSLRSFRSLPPEGARPGLGQPGPGPPRPPFRPGAMKQTLQVRLSQHLALTPQLQQSIRLLQLSTLELHQEVEQMLEQNPFLEAEEDSAPAFEPLAERLSSAERAGERESERAAESTESAGDGGDAGEPTAMDGAAEFGTTDREDWENGTERDDFDGIRETPGKTRTNNDFDEHDESDRDTAAQSLQDHLRDQLAGMRLAPADAAAVLVLIDSLDDDGYLADPLEEIAERLSAAGLRPDIGGEADGHDDPRRATIRASRCWRICAAPCATCRAWSRPASARATSPSASPCSCAAGRAAKRRRSRSSSASTTWPFSPGAT